MTDEIEKRAEEHVKKHGLQINGIFGRDDLYFETQKNLFIAGAKSRDAELQASEARAERYRKALNELGNPPHRRLPGIIIREALGADEEVRGEK